MVDKNYAFDLGERDYLSNRRATIQSMNLSTSFIKENHEKIFSKIFYVVSLILAVFVAVFSDYLNWIIVLIFVDLSFFLLVLFAKDHSKNRKELAKDHYKIIDKLKQFNIKIDKI